MTPQENRALDALEHVSMRMASSGKRFRNDMSGQREHAPDFKLTARQALYLWFLVDMYRRQIKDEELKGWAAHRKLTGELPPIYLEGDHREPVERKSRKKALQECAEAYANCAPRPEQATADDLSEQRLLHF
jgi:hypothetical protein